jgi:hypothetical protein
MPDIVRIMDRIKSRIFRPRFVLKLVFQTPRQNNPENTSYVLIYRKSIDNTRFPQFIFEFDEMIFNPSDSSSVRNIQRTFITRNKEEVIDKITEFMDNYNILKIFLLYGYDNEQELYPVYQSDSILDEIAFQEYENDRQFPVWNISEEEIQELISQSERERDGLVKRKKSVRKPSSKGRKKSVRKSKSKGRKKSVRKSKSKGRKKSVRKPKSKGRKKSVRKPSSACQNKSHISKYANRNSPPYPANECKGDIKTGNDGNTYISKSNKNGIFRWVLY